jgi:hypothetical protein
MVRSFVMPGPVPGIHGLRADVLGSHVDAHGSSPWAEGPRDKPGHDGLYAAMSVIGD